MANIIRGMEIIDAWTDSLNDICKQEGGITKDDARIWDIMHAATTEDWQDIVAALEILDELPVIVLGPEVKAVAHVP